MAMLDGPLARQIGLTDGQKASIKALFTQTHAKPDMGAMKAARDQARAVLKADPVDTVALRTLVAKRQADDAARLARQVDLLGQVRDVLTADQREKLAGLATDRVSKLGSHQPKAGGTHKGHGPQLTDDQRTKLKALMAKRMGKPGDRLTAMAAFWRSGDKAALSASLARPDTTDEAVAFLASLDPATRVKLGGMILGGPRHGFRGHGGHGPRAHKSPAPGAA